MVSYLTDYPYIVEQPAEKKWYLASKYWIFIAVSVAMILLVWLLSFINSNPQRTLNACSVQSKLFTPVDEKKIQDTPPISPSYVAIRVLNSTTKHGAAQKVLTRLKDAGFISSASSIGNDKLLSVGSLQCPGQIRFGSAGLRAAATLRLVFPCSQFVHDARKNPSVDVVLGNEFHQVPITQNSQQAIKKLTKLDLTKRENQSALNEISSSVQCPVKLV